MCEFEINSQCECASVYIYNKLVRKLDIIMIIKL